MELPVTVTIRNATPEDAPLLIQIVDMASEGVVPALWAEMAPDGADGAAVGHALVTEEQGDFSYRNGVVIVQDGEDLGGLIGYPLPMEPEQADSDIPDAFVAVVELANLVRGYWYINFIAVDPKARSHGLGAALLDEAERRAKDSGCPGLALIVTSSNTPAIHAYERAGYEERARRVMDLSDLGFERTDAMLMVKML